MTVVVKPLPMIKAGPLYLLLLLLSMLALQHDSLAAEAKRKLSEAEARDVLVQTIE